ncbi:DUF1549 domain-containing protein [Rhodopirellula sp. MGV]|uniref:DUF1549 domain-containing protein n=1 Tax=Rhodopirellula sp. MGV TaxID=2023130 RepID=UPI000B976D05|nr:DUF1549 domain-containing protein [Rhodopirellula sp. MGV]OYP28897.1 hypothetical protein CGZ80_25345 [Rhodopirellula sp. MGV]PNY36986.1 DUF1549 domain-containing protein [Rhodopirellula baltica]
MANRIVLWLAFATQFIAIDATAADRANKVAANPDRSFHNPTGQIDLWINQRLAADGETAGEQSSDAEFCRRVWLDLAGVAPPIWEVREFISDKEPGKRSRLIERLLESPRFASHMATRYSLALLPQDAGLLASNDLESLTTWLREAFRENKPYDHFVGAFLTASGDEPGPTMFYTTRDADPVKVASATSRLFLGIGIDCAQCHDHPFSKWTQDDFWTFAAFFSQLEIPEQGMQQRNVVRDRVGKELTFPESDRIAEPRYLGVEQPPEPDPTDFRRRQLTIWLASRSNPYFATAAVNRVWAHLFGRGLVNPVDEIDSIDYATHPELLRYLSDYFISIRFDLKQLYRTIAKTDAYQRTSRSTTHRPAAESYAMMHTKTLSPEQYYDSLQQNVIRSGTSDIAQGSQTIFMRQQFAQRMRDSGATPLEYSHGVVQALGMMNGPEMMSATAEQSSGLIAGVNAPFYDDTQRVEVIYLACVSRYPNDDEVKRCLAYLGDEAIEATRDEKFGDLIWVLANTAECFVCP